MDLSATSSAPIAARLHTVLFGLQAALGRFGLEAALAVLLYRRLGVIARQVAGLLRRFQAGTLRPRAARGAAAPATQPRMPAQKTPRRRGWLVAAGKHHAAVFGVQLHTILTAPEMAALLAASPQAVRLLKPLCRALAVDLPIMQPAPRTPKMRIRRQRIRKELPDLGRIPLPRGVLTWARKQGFGKW